MNMHPDLDEATKAELKRSESLLMDPSTRRKPGTRPAPITRISCAGDSVNLKPKKGASDLRLVPAEKVVLFAARAVGALEAADQENCHSQRDQDGQHARVRRNPVK
jgi:hypothetical protein